MIIIIDFVKLTKYIDAIFIWQTLIAQKYMCANLLHGKTKIDSKQDSINCDPM